MSIYAHLNFYTLLTSSRCKYTQVGCGSPYRSKSMGYDTGKLEFELRLCKQNRRDVFVPNLYRLPECHHPLLLNFRNAIEPCRGMLPLTASEEPASHLLEIGSRGEGSDQSPSSGKCGKHFTPHELDDCLQSLISPHNPVRIPQRLT